MFCTKCGKEVKDGSKFCPYCGQPLAQVASKETKEETKAEEVKIEEPKKEVKVEEPKKEEAPSTIKVEEPTPKAQPVAKEPMSKKKIGIIAGIGVAVTAIIAIVCIVIFGPTVLDPLEGGYLETYGYNGFGSIGYVEDGPDYVKIEALYESFDTKEDEYEMVCRLGGSSKKCMDMIEEIYNWEVFFDSVHYEYTYPEGIDNGHLHNGDKVTINLIYDKDALKKAGYKFKKDSITLTVEGLEELEVVDIFEGVDVTWKESWNEFYAEFTDSDNLPIDRYYYVLSDVNDKGEIEVTVDPESLAYSEGIAAKDEVYSKTFKIGSKPEIVKYIDDSNREIIEGLAKDVINGVYLDKCGWNLYKQGNKELVDSTEITRIEAWSSTIYAYFDVKTEKGTYDKKITFRVMKDSNGEYKVITEFDKDSLGCEVSKYGHWDN